MWNQQQRYKNYVFRTRSQISRPIWTIFNENWIRSYNSTLDFSLHDDFLFLRKWSNAIRFLPSENWFFCCSYAISLPVNTRFECGFDMLFHLHLEHLRVFFCKWRFEDAGLNSCRGEVVQVRGQLRELGFRTLNFPVFLLNSFSMAHLWYY